ncbi:hypothetical protein [Agromyces larvae]|uniref:Uncharacterized protein n=1 Tax=Agromyces larvae TaxID=2929802 RepID=A0ABY4C209_9MICO|nr:hypothetical protein [Agromyces larvae]UOE45507.1 hypothetical protein MTO99_07045 [Agromyces larvae]
MTDEPSQVVDADIVDEETGEVADAQPDRVVDEQVESPETIQRWTEYVARRVAAARPPDGAQVKTPDSIVADLEMLGHLAAQNVRILREADRARRVAIRQHKLARARALKDAQGTVAEREAAADLATAVEWERADDAEIAYDYARSMARLVEQRTSAVQTQSKQVELTYQLAGRGGA